MEYQITTEQEAAVAAFAKAHGRTWKSKLNEAWCNGRDAREVDGQLLRQVRNNLGPTWLVNYRLQSKG
jgi:hypothetical protein